MSARTLLVRIALALPTLLAMSVFVFLLVRLIPGDPAQVLLGLRATPENLATIRTDLGLDDSLPQQYVHWLGNVLRGDLGQDYRSGEAVSTLLAQRIPVTLQITLMAMAIAVVVGVGLGVASVRGGRWARRTTSSFVVFGVSVPDFWLGTLLILLFTATLGLLPPAGWSPLGDGLGANLRYVALPVATLAIAQSAYILRTTRAALLGTLGQPYVAFLRVKGISERRIVLRHALRNAAVPIVTVVGIQFGVLLGGAIVIEVIFGLPGLGKLVVDAVSTRNYTVVQGGVLVIATIFIVVNLLTDLVCAWLDPRSEAAEAR